MTAVDDLDRFEAYIRSAEDPVALDAALEAAQRLSAQTWAPLPHQRPPEGKWSKWVSLGGRGAGKTAAVVAWLNDHMEGPPCDMRVPGGHRGGIIAPTFGDAVDAVVNGPSGLRALNPDVSVATERGGITVCRWPNGARARLFGAHTLDDVDRLRAGGNRCADAWEELAAWRQLGDAIANAEMGLRLGPNPQIAASTTPRNRAEIRALKQQADAWPTLALVDLVRAMFGAVSMLNRSDRVALTHATTADNPHLPSDVRGDLFARYGGSRLGKQELEGELLTDVGTMFSRAWFRLIDALPAGRRPRVRYWDLAATVPSPANEDPDWTAGALVEMDRATRTFYVLDVERFRASPGEVAQRVEGIARIDGPDVAVVVEQDPGQAGKDQVAQYKERLRHTARVLGERPTGSKALRALLTATASEAGRVHLLRGDWNLALLDEHEEFTDDDSHNHDDVVDSLSGALAVLERGLGGGMSAGTSAAAMTHGRVLRNGGR